MLEKYRGLRVFNSILLDPCVSRATLTNFNFLICS